MKLVDKSNVECYQWPRYGYCQSECWNNLNREYRERANFVEKGEESLLLMCHMKEETQQNMWHLDSGDRMWGYKDIL